MLFFDPYMIIVIPFLLLSLYASYKVKSTFNKYAQVASYRGLTGAQAARELLHYKGLDIPVEMSRSGFLSDHYDPEQKVLRLSPEVYESNSVAALGVAAHETGHALQQKDGYAALALRSSLVPAANFGSNGGIILFMIGLFVNLPILLKLGIIFFSLAVLFYIITLPVEFNASSRAVALLTSSGIITRQEEGGVRAVLSAAALTYVAAALTAIAQLVRLILIARNRD
jgi:Zn-dependent membrane protease YugP